MLLPRPYFTLHTMKKQFELKKTTKWGLLTYVRLTHLTAYSKGENRVIILILSLGFQEPCV